jgi:COMPASS component SWD3
MSTSPPPSPSPFDRDQNFNSELTQQRPLSAHSSNAMDIDSRERARRRRSSTPRSTPSHSQSPPRRYYHESPPDEQVTYRSRRAEPLIQLRYKPSLTLEGHKKAVSAVKFSPDGTKIASCCTSRRSWRVHFEHGLTPF